MNHDAVFDLLQRVRDAHKETRAIPLPLFTEVCRALYDAAYADGRRDVAESIAVGKSRAPTDAEIDAHRKRRGSWLVSWDRVRLLRPCDVRRVARFYRERGTPARWIPLDACGVAVAWPVVEGAPPVDPAAARVAELEAEVARLQAQARQGGSDVR